MAKVLLIRPHYAADPNSVYGAYWLEQAREYASAVGHDVVDLYAEDAVNTNVWQAIQDEVPALLLGVGHGAYNRFTAQHGSTVFHSDGCLLPGRGKIIDLISCQVGKKLLPDMVDAGAVSSIGYMEDWLWVMAYGHPPATDPYSKAFYESLMAGIEVILDDGSPLEANQASRDMYTYWTEIWAQSSDVNASQIIKTLLWDRDNLTAYGDDTAVLSSIQPSPYEVGMDQCPIYAYTEAPSLGEEYVPWAVIGGIALFFIVGTS